MENEMLKQEKKEKYLGPTMPFYIHILKEASMAFLLLGVLITLAVFFPPELDVKADPFVTPEHIKPEWYFLAGYQLLKLADMLSFLGSWAPKIIGVVGQGVFILLLLALPLIDRNPDKFPSQRRGMITIGILSIIGFVALTAWGHFS